MRDDDDIPAAKPLSKVEQALEIALDALEYYALPGGFSQDVALEALRKIAEFY